MRPAGPLPNESAPCIAFPAASSAARAGAKTAEGWVG